MAKKKKEDPIQEIEQIEQVEEVQEIEDKGLSTKNPFNKGVTYEMFLENVKGNVTEDSLLKKLNLDEDSLAWVKKELETYKKNKK